MCTNVLSLDTSSFDYVGAVALDPHALTAIRGSRASVSGRMDVYYAQKIAKYVQN